MPSCLELEYSAGSNPVARKGLWVRIPPTVRSIRVRVMKSYPSIAYANESPYYIIAFDKLDGSNIRAEWSLKKGWYKFGTRNQLIDLSHPIFGQAPRLITEKYGDLLAKALYDAGYKNAVCFFELWGPTSFAGMHNCSEKQTVTLFDVAPSRQGILMPEHFLQLFGHLDIAKVLYRGPCTAEFIQQVRTSTLADMTFEGVVCKSSNNKKTKMPIMFKQKSKAWIEKLQIYCGDQKDMLRTLM